MLLFITISVLIIESTDACYFDNFLIYFNVELCLVLWTDRRVQRFRRNCCFHHQDSEQFTWH